MDKKQTIIILIILSLVSCGGGGGGGSNTSNTSPDSMITFVDYPAVLWERAGVFSISAPKVAADSSGNAIVVWSADDVNNLGRSDIWASRFNKAESSWSIPIVIENSDSDFFDPKIDIDSEGNAIVVWWQRRDGDNAIWANRYDINNGWEQATPLEFGTDGSSTDPSVQFDDHGNATVVWQRFDGFETGNSGEFSVWANRYENNVGWGTAQNIDSGERSWDRHIQLFVEPSGNAYVAWRRGRFILVNRFQPHIGWGEEEIVNLGIDALRRDFNNAAPSLTQDGLGNIIVVWWSGDLSDRDIRIVESRLPANNTKWETKEIITSIEDSDNTSFLSFGSLQVRSDMYGNSVLTYWVNKEAYSSTYIVGEGWGDPTRIDTMNGQMSDLRLTFDGASNYIAVGKCCNPSEYWITRYNIGSSWSKPEILSNNSDTSLPYGIAMNEAGNFYFTWYSYFNIWIYLE